jgi:hypothetical protein
MLRLFIAALSVASTCACSAAPDPALAGCWRSVKIVQTLADGKTIEDTSGRCMLEFRAAQFESVCTTSAGLRASSTYSYEITKPNAYTATMTASSFRTQLIGSKRDYEYRIEGGRLFIVTTPQAAAPGSAAAVRSESESVKETCPGAV